ncbi:class I SAM-dependent methyltransferase [Pelagibius marinus]|uniref:class I SAM-dependent methyltransferase n=1 Tax=Pelagibius marinus TaxID=2762760 RepID=UPI0018733D31|nr:class I SAM-dependent methyltransferase [Pelagibius marinus]
MAHNLIEGQRRSFDSLVERGVYDADFDHAPAAKTFVANVLGEVRQQLPWKKPLTVLDCGCGTGAWLTFLHAQLSLVGFNPLRLCGFDLSYRMVEVAREKLQGLALPDDLRTGNVLDRQSYAFEGLSVGFDLIFTYDVIQQLPRSRQAEACEMMIAALAPQGMALIFDNDSATRFGRRMALRKFLTRYCGLRLVPRYYCNASYPPLERFRRQFDRTPPMRARIMARADGSKRAMIVDCRGDAGQ